MRVFVRRNGNKLRDYVWRRKRTGGVFDGNKLQRRSKESWKAVINKRKTVNRAGGNEAFRWCLCFLYAEQKTFGSTGCTGTVTGSVWFIFVLPSWTLRRTTHAAAKNQWPMTDKKSCRWNQIFFFGSIIKLWHGGQN